jgi:enediyne biosynthesis protein E2
VSTTLGSLRRLVLTPSLREVTFAARGFPDAATAPRDRVERLEAIPQSVICGFEWGIDSRDQWEVERRLAVVEPALRPFAYEGATMAFTVRDVMAGGRGHRTQDLLQGPGLPHIFLSYIGIGFAMARLPRPLWRNILPELPDFPLHPMMSWLAVDGYGFDLAYFHTARWVDKQEVPRPYPWQGAPEYFNRAVDQGIGRALWFLHAAQAARLPAAVERFAVPRQPDLWSGVGVAATMAGGAPPEELRALAAAAGGCRPELAQGAVFAATARAFTGHMTDHTAAATTALTDLSVDDALVLAGETGQDLDQDAGVPAYEVWRQRLQRRFAPAGRAGAASG